MYSLVHKIKTVCTSSLPCMQACIFQTFMHFVILYYYINILSDDIMITWLWYMISFYTNFNTTLIQIFKIWFSYYRITGINVLSTQQEMKMYFIIHFVKFNLIFSTHYIFNSMHFQLNTFSNFNIFINSKTYHCNKYKDIMQKQNMYATCNSQRYCNTEVTFLPIIKNQSLQAMK